MKNQLEQFKKASDIYIERTQQEADVIGIIVSGSFVHGTLDKNSDIDIYVVLDANCTYRERGNTWINGVEIEYFKNPPQQIRQYFKAEKSPHTADMIAKGNVVYSNHPVIDELRQEASSIINTPLKPIPKVVVELGKYMLDDMYKDLEDAQISQDQMAIALIQSQIINYSIDLFCKIHRIRRTKHKRLFTQLTDANLVFAQVVKQALSAPNIDTLQHLRQAIEEELGGSRPKEWRLRSSLDL